MRSLLPIAVGVTLLVSVAVGLGSVGFADDATYRAILKTGGLLGAIAGLNAISVAGYFSGRDYGSYTGWERYTHGAGMFFNREPFRRINPPGFALVWGNKAGWDC